MPTLHAYTSFKNPGLHIWREGAETKLYLHPTSPLTQPGWVEFEYDFEPTVSNDVRFLLFGFDDNGNPAEWEKEAHQRTLPRTSSNDFAEVWFAQDAARVLTLDPTLRSEAQIRIHLISRTRYRPSQLYVWDPVTRASQRLDLAGEDQLGPFFNLQLNAGEQSFFLFKFIRRKDGTQDFVEFEPEHANRLWSAHDGKEVWTHSEADEITPAEPRKCKLRLHYRQEFPEQAVLRYWQQNSEAEHDALAVASATGWQTFEVDLYTELGYGLQFYNPQLPGTRQWEHAEAKRFVHLTGDKTYWTVEGDHHLFTSEPKLDHQIDLTLSIKPPYSRLHGSLFAHVWINRARGPLHQAVQVDARGHVSFPTFPDVVTSLKFRDEHGHWESVERHVVEAPLLAAAPTRRFGVLERSPLLASAPPANLFQNPPFNIRRPGAYSEGGDMHFVVHAPNASRARVIGEWTGWKQKPVEMHSTEDGSYWWARIPITDILQGRGSTDFHGAEYKYLFNDDEDLQDPAAGWVKSSWNRDASKLIDSDQFHWSDNNWQRPGWEYLNVYQIHVSRFSNRFQNEVPLRRVALEIDDQAGYLRDLGITAILLLPLNEVGTTNSWGYDPAYFYAIENSYGGPDALKELVDVCHKHGLAVLLDVVFNHAGSADNILWSVARESFFDGDTAWGAMINYDHPQCRHFFAQNLVYLAQEYHIDGFRLDHTATIVHSNVWNDWSGSVRIQGSGGGWDFLHALRHALHTQVDSRCILMAEHLPNEWALTAHGGPMDTQWCDNFHDRMVDACKREFGMSRLADAFKLSQTACQQWYNVTNYPESHDEVGNVRDRIAHIAGWGQGYRMSKVAAAGALLSRGIPMFFMGAESAEDQQFTFGSAATLDLNHYLSDPDKSRVRAWWQTLSQLRRGNSALSGPSPIEVRFAEGQLLAFSRGERPDYFVVLNFGGWSGYHNLGYLGLPEGTFRELWNSTWPAFAIAGENEDEHSNWGRDARLNGSHGLHIPEYGAVVLERVG